MIYVLALLGALLAKAGDVAGTISVRRGSVSAIDLFGALAWLLCYPVWREMSRRTNGGLTRPAALWDLACAILWVGVMILFGEAESTAKRVLLFVGIVALGAREVIK